MTLIRHSRLQAVAVRWSCLLTAALLLANAPAAWGAKILLKNGMVLEGAVAPIPSMSARPSQGGGPGDAAGRIVVVDDELRRSYIGFNNVREVREGDAGDVQEVINVPQRSVVTIGRQVYSMGPIIKATPFDNFGRRILTMQGPEGPLDIIQGITRISPRWTQIQSLRGPGQAMLLDQRIATSSLSSAQLAKILNTVIDAKNPDHRLKVVRFFLQADRYNEAQAELEAVVRDFPEFAGLERELDNMRQLRARRGLDELKLRRDAGQHVLTRRLLGAFPSQGVADETLFQVREVLGGYQEVDARLADVRERLQALLAQIETPSEREELTPLVEEIVRDLNIHTLDRMTSFRQKAGDATLGASERLSLAISGWLIGSDDATDNAAVAASLVRVRALIVDFLNEPLQPEREALITYIRSEEAGLPRYAALLVKHMKPSLPPGQADERIAGLFHLTVPGLTGQSDVTYHVQLPPEYDPYRRYPAVLSLHGASTNGLLQIDWWAGGAAESGQRLGQATRHGYIVIAPEWGSPRQRKYGYSAREHAAVLDSLRDACRRFSIDTDRVYLTGHSMGGDAAWDIGLAHPDLWAGVIPIVALADSSQFNYVARYWENARYVPFYFVCGELDGNKMVANATQFDRYLPRLGFDCMVVEYQGRGHENFQDEVLRLFEWMGKQSRNFFPEDFKCATIRSWDNYFWWVEVSGLPASNVADPQNWPPPRGMRGTNIEGSVRKSPDGEATVRVKSAANHTTVWLAPEMVNFDKRVRVLIGTRAFTGPKPDVETLLDDVRTRGDRQHPFWARIDLPGG